MRAPTVIAMVCAGSACVSGRAAAPTLVTRSATKPPGSEVNGALPTRSVVSPGAAWLLSHGELIVGSRHGLFAYGISGMSRRLLSQGPALHPRWYDAHSVLVLHPVDGSEAGKLQLGVQVEQVSLLDGTRRVRVEVPPLQCDGSPDQAQPRLSLADPNDFSVDGARQVACLNLMDAGWNRARTRVELRLDLAHHSFSRWASIGLEWCALPPDVQRGNPPEDEFCPADSHSEPVQPLSPVFEYRFEQGRVLGPTGRAEVRLPEYSVERVSSSGRWALLAGDLAEGDYVYRRFVLLDRATGQLFAVPEAAKPWPFPLTPTAAGVATPVESAALWSGETDVRFLSDGRGGDLLIIGRLVIVPGQSMFDLTDGTVAR